MTESPDASNSAQHRRNPSWQRDRDMSRATGYGGNSCPADLVTAFLSINCRRRRRPSNCASLAASEASAAVAASVTQQRLTGAITIARRRACQLLSINPKALTTGTVRFVIT